MNITKQQGTIGQLKIAQDLIQKGYYVFSEIGDNSSVDLIGIKNNKITTFQVKCYNSKKGKVAIYLHNTTRSYSRKYNSDDFNWFAIYVIDRDIILYVKLEEVYKNSSSMEIRIDKPKKQNNSINYFEKYLELKE